MPAPRGNKYAAGATNGGRPTKYTSECIAKVDDYLNGCVDERYIFHKTEGDKSDSYEEKVRVNLPTIGGFALFLDVAEDTIYEWVKVHKEFSESLRKIVKEQEKRLLNSGLSGEYNSTIAKLILSSNHGYKEKSDLTTNDKDIPQPILNVQRNNGDKKDNGVKAED